MEILVAKFDENEDDTWDDFVIKKSVNGTFLQSRRFLNYHPIDRFVDDSLIFRNGKKHIVAVCPACVKYENEKKVFMSHGGSTYGEIVFSEAYYTLNTVLSVLKNLRIILRENHMVKLL